MTPEDVAWAAGFIEGEGSFSLVGRGYRGTDGKGLTQMVQVVQKDPECLHRLVVLFGGKVRHRTRASKRNLGGDTHYWIVTGEQARALLTAIYPYLSQRRKARATQVLGRVMWGRGRNVDLAVDRKSVSSSLQTV